MIFWIPGYQGFDPSPTYTLPLSNIIYILSIVSLSFLAFILLLWLIHSIVVKKIKCKSKDYEFNNKYRNLQYSLVSIPLLLLTSFSSVYTFSNNIKMNEILEIKEVQIIDKSSKSILIDDAFVWFNDDNKTNSTFVDFLTNDKNNQKIIGKSAKVDFITQEYKVLKTMNISYEQMSKAFYGQLNIWDIKN